MDILAVKVSGIVSALQFAADNNVSDSLSHKRSYVYSKAKASVPGESSKLDD